MGKKRRLNFKIRRSSNSTKIELQNKLPYYRSEIVESTMSLWWDHDDSTMIRRWACGLTTKTTKNQSTRAFINKLVSISANANSTGRRNQLINWKHENRFCFVFRRGINVEWTWYTLQRQVRHLGHFGFPIKRSSSTNFEKRNPPLKAWCVWWYRWFH